MAVEEDAAVRRGESHGGDALRAERAMERGLLAVAQPQARRRIAQRGDHFTGVPDDLGTSFREDGDHGDRMAGEFAGDDLEVWHAVLAFPAPRGPEMDEQRLLVLGDRAD